MTNRILWKDNELQWDGSDLLWVPTGSEPEDCECCGAATCFYCEDPGQGGPYSRVDFVTVVSGFISTYKKTGFSLVPGQPGLGMKNYIDTVTGLDAANGTWNTAWEDPNCALTSESFLLTGGLERVWHAGSGCTPTAPIYNTINYNAGWLLVIRGGSIEILYAGASNIPFEPAPFFKVDNTLFGGQACTGTSGNEPYSSFCPGSSFTIAFTQTPTGTP